MTPVRFESRSEKMRDQPPLSAVAQFTARRDKSKGSLSGRLLTVTGVGTIVLPTQSATTTITVTPIAGLNANLKLSCPELPTNAACSLANGDQVAVNNQTTSATVIVQAYVPKSAAAREILRPRGVEVCGLFGIAFVFAKRRRRAISGLIGSVLLIFVGLSLDMRLWIRFNDQYPNSRNL